MFLLSPVASLSPAVQVDPDGGLSASSSGHVASSLLSCLSSVGPSLLSQLGEGEAAPLLRVNFDPMLIRLLREVKYFLLLHAPVPDSALKVYKRAEVFRQQTGNLELIVNTYNGILVRLKTAHPDKTWMLQQLLHGLAFPALLAACDGCQQEVRHDDRFCEASCRPGCSF